MGTDYRIEKRMLELAPDLHNRYRNCVAASHRMLSRYESVFPDFTDHSVLHTLGIVDYCNTLIGEQLSRLTADDLYVLLLGAVFHDVGMGVSKKEFEQFLLEECPSVPMPTTVEEIPKLTREWHHELSGWYVRKYWRLFDIPNEAYAAAIIQVCRGHRKTDLLDTAQYPQIFPAAEGRTVCLSYLAALVRLADEMDIAANRNISILYEPEKMAHAIDRFMFKKHRSIQRVDVLPDRIRVTAATDDPEIYDGIVATVDKLSETLEDCRRAVEPTPFVLYQEKVELDLKALWKKGESS